MRSIYHARLAALAALLAACASGGGAGGGARAVADLQNAAGDKVGTAELTPSGDAVRIVVEVERLEPGQHGVHIHEMGSCEPPDFKSAGDHFNPEGKEHGTLNPAGPHAGDLPNLPVGGDGSGRMETTTGRVTLGPGPSSLLDPDGSAVVVHAEADDYRSQPSGNSGDRVACGVIRRVEGAERTRTGY